MFQDSLVGKNFLSTFFFNVGPLKEDIFLTTIYGLYFSIITHITNYNCSHVGTLWLSCTAPTPVFRAPCLIYRTQCNH